jgi:hypothetical protein
MSIAHRIASILLLEPRPILSCTGDIDSSESPTRLLLLPVPYLCVAASRFLLENMIAKVAQEKSLEPWVDEYGTGSCSDRVLSEAVNFDDQKPFVLRERIPEATSAEPLALYWVVQQI